MPLSFYHDLLWREVIYISLSLCFDRWTLYTFHFMWTASSFDMKDWAGKRRHEVKSTRCEENTRTLIKYWGWRFWSNWNPNFVPKNLEQAHQIRSRIVPSHVIHLEAITDLQHESAAKKKHLMSGVSHLPTVFARMKNPSQLCRSRWGCSPFLVRSWGVHFFVPFCVGPAAWPQVGKFSSLLFCVSDVFFLTFEKLFG